MVLIEPVEDVVDVEIYALTWSQGKKLARALSPPKMRKINSEVQDAIRSLASRFIKEEHAKDPCPSKPLKMSWEESPIRSTITTAKVPKSVLFVQEAHQLLEQPYNVNLVIMPISWIRMQLSSLDDI